ncbi:MAG TPA: murein L,D-transpeptidase catalytic domain family protein, partial [Gemmatimonadaceae bacterium]
MRTSRILQSILIGGVAVLVGAARVVPTAQQTGPVLAAATSLVSTPAPASNPAASSPVAASTKAALDALEDLVRPLSHPRALDEAFRGYYTYKAANPGQVKKPYLYFVDYGLPGTAKRGYVFDMERLKIVDGPFTVAHGSGSSSSKYGIPTRFSNSPGSGATSLGLYLTQETYGFTGHSGGRTYSSIGLRLKGLSGKF